MPDLLLRSAIRPALRSTLRSPLVKGVGGVLRNVGTKLYLPNQLLGAYRYLQTRSPHFSPVAITALRVVLPNWYVVRAGTGIETGTGGTVTFTASVEYPAGTFTQIKFSGAVTSHAVADLTSIISDEVAVAIPAGALYWIRVWANYTAGIPFDTNSSANYDSTNGQATKVSIGSITDQTMSGTVTNTSADLTWTPVGILARTASKSVLSAGDSRLFGINDTAPVNSSQFRGVLDPSLGPSVGIVNGGVAAISLQYWLTGNARQIEMAGYASSFISEFGINDMNNGRTAAQIIANQQLLAALVGKPTFLTTLPPWTTGAWTLADGSDQTVKSFEAQRVAYNTAVRAGIAGIAGYFEIADQVESARNSGKWKAPGYTTDGIHESSTANEAIRASGAVSAAVLY